MKKAFYITTTLPYVNAAPHIGFALEIVQADVIARTKRQEGHEVVFNTGTDEHGLKIYQEALEEKRDPQAYADEYAPKFDRLRTALNLSYTNFIRTTDEHHAKAAQEFWERCAEHGDIEKRMYRVKYCVGCELEKTDSELVDGKCPIHSNQELERIEEENYFFAFSRYQKKLLELYQGHPDFVVPESRLREITKFVEQGLADFSISRLKAKMPWGIPVPGDNDHVIYVWFDALVNYISTIGWPEDETRFGIFWPGIQVAGKDNLRQQSAMWQAMLMSAGLPPSRQIFIHGFITSSGEKMSKSLGNVIDPIELAQKYGTDAVRYYLLREIPAYEDGDFSYKKFEERYNADLANGLGNFAARVLTLAEGCGEFENTSDVSSELTERINVARETIKGKLNEYKFHEAVAALWELIAHGDKLVNDAKPWTIKETEERKHITYPLVVLLDNIAALLAPFLPHTAEKIAKSITWSGNVLSVKKVEILFPRLT